MGDRWKKQAGRARERACLDREKIPCGGSESLKSSAKEGAPVLSGSNINTHMYALSHTHTLKAILLHLVTFIPFSPPHPHPLIPYACTTFRWPKRKQQHPVANALLPRVDPTGDKTNYSKSTLSGCLILWGPEFKSLTPTRHPHPPSIVTIIHKKNKNLCQLTSSAEHIQQCSIYCPIQRRYASFKTTSLFWHLAVVGIGVKQQSCIPGFPAASP